MVIVVDAISMVIGGQVDAEDYRDGNHLRPGKQDDRVGDQGESPGWGCCHH